MIIRTFTEADSLTELTRLLHRAYRGLAEMGLRFLATYQTDRQTQERIDNGTCLVAEIDGRIVGTIMYYNCANAGGTAWYDRPEVCSFGQFGVEPELQGAGIGTRLLEAVEVMARNEGAEEIALDTAEPAHHLIAYYSRHGYRLVDHTQWDAANYRSVIMSKRLQQ
ncbi:MAG: GNAT family N-acetyltransferase [Bacteroidetes bacterium]|nr:GNAT family N-acetyltransferase [Bacteroidota bacterium]